ncbi:MAG: DUF4382 domain-containing protein [Firmicutes bacterium]|nr:DUF4382 domain-containing protein [Bacillota bacterium]
MKKLFSMTVLFIFLSAILAGCGSGGTGEQAKQSENKIGTLQFTANGEDFVRQGFTSKDGWDVSFDHVYINLADITAYQADPPYDADEGGEVQAETKVSIPGVHTVDLAAGDQNASPIMVSEKEMPTGHYNAISWKMLKASEGPAQGYSLVVAGKAAKNGKTVNFTLKNEKQYKYTGGEFIGDQRKGIVQEGKIADLEMTFHFDHIFGDAGTPADDELNVGAPGFAPFVGLAADGKVDINMAGLKEKLSPEDYQKLETTLTTLGHVGEGHCYSEVL